MLYIDNFIIKTEVLDIAQKCNFSCKLKIDFKEHLIELNLYQK